MRSDHLKKHTKTHGPKRNAQTQAAINQNKKEAGKQLIGSIGLKIAHLFSIKNLLR